MLSNVIKNLVLGQHPSVLAPIAQALHFMTVTSKS
jgi:hypothetical protein